MPSNNRGYAVLVVIDGEEEFLCVGMTTQVARFPTKLAATRQADFLFEGLDEGDSVTVVNFPSKERLKADGYTT